MSISILKIFYYCNYHLLDISTLVLYSRVEMFGNYKQMLIVTIVNSFVVNAHQHFKDFFTIVTITVYL